jgi:hypothetical protein
VAFIYSRRLPYDAPGGVLAVVALTGGVIGVIVAGTPTTRPLTPFARIRPASARSRPCRPAIRGLQPRNSNGALPGWVTSAR